MAMEDFSLANSTRVLWRNQKASDSIEWWTALLPDWKKANWGASIASTKGWTGLRVVICD